MLNHLKACPYCPKHEMVSMDGLHPYIREVGRCSIYADTSWVNRRGGCGMFPYVELPPGLSYLGGMIVGSKKAGQQKQKRSDRSYHSKNDGKRKYTYHQGLEKGAI